MPITHDPNDIDVNNKENQRLWMPLWQQLQYKLSNILCTLSNKQNNNPNANQNQIASSYTLYYHDSNNNNNILVKNLRQFLIGIKYFQSKNDKTNKIIFKIKVK